MQRRKLLISLAAPAIIGSKAFAQDVKFPINNGISAYGIRGRSRIGILGDSYQQQPTGGTYGISPTLNAASISLLNVYAGQPWYFTSADNFASASGTSTTMLQHINACLARRPQIIFVGGLHNDIISGISLSTSQTQYTLIIKKIINAGIIPVCILDPSINTTESYSGTLAQLRQGITNMNNFIRYTAANYGLLTWDWHTPTLDLTNAAGPVLASYTSDSIHLNTAGQSAVAVQGLIDLAQIIGPPLQGALVVNQDDLYDPTYNPYGNLLTDSQFLASVNNTPTGMTGQAPGWHGGQTGVFPSPDTGKVFASSIVTSADGIGSWWQVAISGTGLTSGSNQETWLSPPTFGSTLSAGTYVEGWVQVKISANSPFSAVMIKLVAGANISVGNYSTFTGEGGTDPGTTNAWSGTIYVPPLQIPASGFSFFTANLLANFNDSSVAPGANGLFTGTVQFRRPTFRIVNPTYIPT